MIVELGSQLLKDAGYGPFTVNSRDTGLGTQTPPAGYDLAARSRYFAVYTRPTCASSR